MGLKKKLEDTIDEPETGWRAKWGKALSDFLAGVLSWGFDLFMNVLGKSFAPKLRPIIDKIEESGEVPEEMKPILDELKEPKGEIAAMLGSALGFSMVGGAIGKITDALFLRMGYFFMKRFHPVLPDTGQSLAFWLRHPETEEQLEDWLKAQGADDSTREVLKDLAKGRLDVGTVTALWRRNKAFYEFLWKDIQDQGIDPGRIAFLKELAKIIPPVADMVRFADYSSFDPEVIARWREFYDAPDWIANPMSLIGIENDAPRDWANKYWFSHWRQPGRYELGDMYRRGLLGKPLIGAEEIEEAGGEGEAEDTIKLAYKTMGYSSFWQDMLLQLVREVPTRVDVRRWWDMRTIDETELRSIYQRQGYFGKDLNNYILWTKVYVAFPDLVARYKNGWITEDEVKSELTALGMPSERVEEMWQTKFKKMQPERTVKERDLTATEIMKGVKKGILDWTQGEELLMDMGYDKDEANLKLQIYIGVAEGSPETYTEFKQWTQLYRKAQGLSSHIPPAELQEAEISLREAEAAYKEAETKGLIREKLAPFDKAKSDATYRYRQLFTKWLEEIKQK